LFYFGYDIKNIYPIRLIGDKKDCDNMKNGKKNITSVLKAAEILETISESESGLGVTEIGRRIGLGVSSIHHILSTLRSRGLVMQDPRTKKYYLGFGLFRICAQAERQNLLGNLAQPYLKRLSLELNETANLGILDGSDIVCVAQIEGSHMSRFFAKIGIRTPFYHAAGGKLLASLQPRENWDVLMRNIRFEKYTKNTILSAEALIAELETTRARGYGIDNEEREEGVICIAAPVFNDYGEPVASLGVSGPTLRLADQVDAVVGKVIEVAADFSREMGYPPEDKEA
jgi:IclR family acetate operon transcriptional repressor